MGYFGIPILNPANLLLLVLAPVVHIGFIMALIPFSGRTVLGQVFLLNLPHQFMQR
jgi:hypothetical protein